MPWTATEQDYTVRRALERWKIVAFEEVDMIGGWRDADADSLTHYWTYGCTVPQSGPPKMPNRLYTDTAYLFGEITARYPKLDPNPLQEVYAAIAAWYADHSADRIPPQPVLFATLERAIMALQAVDHDIESRLIREDGSDLVRRLLESTAPPLLTTTESSRLREYLGSPGCRENPARRQKLQEILSHNDELTHSNLVRSQADAAPAQAIQGSAEVQSPPPPPGAAATLSPLPRIAADFRTLANRFVEYARRAEKPEHLAASMQQSAVRAGRLVQEAADAGAFQGDACWRGNESPMSDGKSASEAERYLILWVFTVGSWLAKRFPSRFRENAGAWDWSHVAKNPEGRLLGKDGKPLRGRWYKDGKPLPYTFKGNPFDTNFLKCAPGEYEWRLEGKDGRQIDPGDIAKQTDFYDQADCLEHLRIRCEVYADACKVLAEVIDKEVTARAKKPGNRKVWLTVTRAAKLLAKDLSLNIKKAMARVSKAAGAGKFLTNDKKGAKRRIEKVSFDAWRLAQRDSDLDSEDE